MLATTVFNFLKPMFIMQLAFNSVILDYPYLSLALELSDFIK